MENLFNVSKYRNYLENYFVHAIDKNTVSQRKSAIDKYDDEFLQKIIDDTRTFIIYLLKEMKKQQNIYEEKIFIELDGFDEYNSIYNGCCGGSSADEIYFPTSFGPDFYVSKYLLKQFFQDFSVELVDDIYESYDEEFEMGCTYIYTKLYIAGFIKKFEDIVEDVLKDDRNQELVLKSVEKQSDL